MTGVSDFQKLIATATKTNFVKNIAKIKDYRDYEIFDADMFGKELSYGLRNMHSFNCGEFQKILLDNLNRYTPTKKKSLHRNNNKSMTKSLTKTIMHRSRDDD